MSKYLSIKSMISTCFCTRARLAINNKKMSSSLPDYKLTSLNGCFFRWFLKWLILPENKFLHKYPIWWLIGKYSRLELFLKNTSSLTFSCNAWSQHDQTFAYRSSHRDEFLENSSMFNNTQVIRLNIAQNVQTGHHRDLRKTSHVKQITSTLRYMVHDKRLLKNKLMISFFGSGSFSVG